MVKALIGLGANLGRPAENLEAAQARLANLKSTRLISLSDWLATTPVGGPDNQDEFLNGAALLETVLCPDDLATALQQVEQDLGRQRIIRWGPRLIDLDIILYGNRIVDTPQLTIPHPWMALRRFVLEPANQIASNMRHPQIGMTVGELFANLEKRPTYIEITGLSSVDTTATANWLIGEVNGLAAFPRELNRAASWALVDGLGADAAIELLEQWSLSSPAPDVETIVVSDRWREEILVVGKVCFSSQDFAKLQAAWRARQRAERRKLLVVLADSTQWNQDALSVEFWNRVRSPGHGPWIVLDISKPQRMRHDLLAAVRGMQ